MHDFPPRVSAYLPDSVQTPDTRSPSRYIGWLARSQLDLLAVSVLVGLLWFGPSALSPYLLGRAIDQGVVRHDVGAAALWAALLMGTITIGVFAGVAMHTTAVTSWLIALYGNTQLTARKSTQMGHVLTRRTPTGEVVSVAMTDSDTFGAVMEAATRTVAALFAFLFVAGIVLSTSLKLGLVVLIAAPILVGAATPLLHPLHRSQAVERVRSSELTGMATDIVAGLRILRGIGGESTFGRNYAVQSQKTREAGVRAGTWQAVVDALGVLLAGLLLVILTWLGAHEMMAGRLTIGQLISFFGYAIFMVWPIGTFFEAAQKWVQALVAAKQTISVLGQDPPWRPAQQPVSFPADAQLMDEASGFVARPGLFTVVVSAVPDDTAALADRLGRYLPSEAEPISTAVDASLKGRAAKRARAEKAAERARLAAEDEARAAALWGVSANGIDLSQFDLADLRRHVLVSEPSAQLFAGTLREAVDPHGRASRAQAEEALRVADAEDVYDALPGGWQGHIDERGRGLSGGQRQRLVLARALLADSDILVLVEPTSAVDAHTEARIAERLARFRRGRTTVVTSVSPLLLHHADAVAFMDAGRITATGTHAQLLATNPTYRDVVARGLDEQEEVYV